MRTFLQYKNDQNIAAWQQRMALTGGKGLLDMRTDQERHSYTTVIERGVWRLQLFMVHVRHVHERRAADQKERLKWAMGRHKENRVQQQLF